MPSTVERPSTERPASTDLVLALAFAVLAFSGSLWVSAKFDPLLYESERRLADGRTFRTFNIWYDADFPKVMAMMMDRQEAHETFAAKHPIHRPVLYSTAYAFKLVGFAPVNRLRAFAALGAALWAAGLFVLLRLIGLRRSDAALFTLLGLSSAASLFWLSVPESFTLGSVTIMVALAAAALVDRRAVPVWALVVASAASLSITVTNWMVGLFTTWFSQPWRRALTISVIALATVSALWALQLLIIPRAVYFLSVGNYDSRFMLDPASIGPGHVAASFFAHTMVMPDIAVTSTSDPVWYGMTTQGSLPGSAGALGLVALGCWVVLLIMSAYAMLRLRTHLVLRRVLAATVLMQVVLHSIYGHETFLYSLHFLPLLVGGAALTTLTSLRRPALSVAAALLVFGAISNARQLRNALHTVQRIATIAASQQ